MTAVTTAMMSRDPLSLPWQNWPVHLGPSEHFQTFWGYCKFWLLVWNTKMHRENSKIKFRYYLFGKNTTSLPVMILRCSFREAAAACRWVLVLPSDPHPLNIWLLVSACSRLRGITRLGQSWWRQRKFFPWTVATVCSLKLLHWLFLDLFTVYCKKITFSVPLPLIGAVSVVMLRGLSRVGCGEAGLPVGMEGGTGFWWTVRCPCAGANESIPSHRGHIFPSCIILSQLH